jgi:hypothetical protein
MNTVSANLTTLGIQKKYYNNNRELPDYSSITIISSKKEGRGEIISSRDLKIWEKNILKKRIRAEFFEPYFCNNWDNN